MQQEDFVVSKPGFGNVTDGSVAAVAARHPWIAAALTTGPSRPTMRAGTRW